MTSELDTRRRRAAWRAGHRGTKEMDILLGRWADANLGALADPELDRFERFLELPDPELQRAILSGDRLDDPEMMEFVGIVRAFHQLAPAAT